MGQVRKQGIATFAFSYLGVALGYVNKTLLFANILLTDYFGLVEFFIAAMTILANFAFLGLPNVINRYYHYLVPRRKELGSFNVMVIAIPALAMTFISLLLIGLKPWISGLFSERSPLVGEKYWYFFLLLFSFVWFELFAAYSSAIVKNIVPVFLREVALRLGQTVAVLLLWFGVVSQDGFLLLFVLTYWINLFAIVFYLRWLGRFPLGFHFAIFRSRFFKSILRYGTVTFLATLAWGMVQRADITLMGYYVDLETVGIYSLVAYMGTLIYMPGRTLSVISLPMFSRAFREKRMDKVKELYMKSSLNNLVAGGILVMLVYYNLDSLLSFLKPEFQVVKWPIVVVCLAKWFDISTGVGGSVLLSSRYYTLMLWSALVLMVFVVAGNVIAIPWQGIWGATVVSAAGTVLFNLIVVLTVYRQLGILPFHVHAVRLLPALGLGIAAGELLPWMGSPLLDILLRSALITAIYVAMVLWLKVSEDINQVGRNVVQRLGFKS